MSKAARSEAPSRRLYDLIDAATKGNRLSVGEFLGKRVRINGGNFSHETTISDVALRVGGTGKDIDNTVCLENVEFMFAETRVLVNKGRWKLPRIINRLSFAPRRMLHGLLLLIFESDGYGHKEVSVELLD
jgi:hypothetical protein